MTFDEWYDDPVTQDALPVKARDVTRAAFEAGAQTARHSALVDAVAEVNRVSGGCDCNFAPCEHDQVRIRIVSAIVQLAAAPAEGEPEERYCASLACMRSGRYPAGLCPEHAAVKGGGKP